MYLIAWSLRPAGPVVEPADNDGVTDHWRVEETYPLAVERYNAALKLENLYSASLCNVILSTDYEGVPDFNPNPKGDD